MIAVVELTTFLPGIALIMGAAIGAISGFYLAHVQHRNTVAGKLVDQIFKVRKDLVRLLSDVANLRVGEPISAQAVDKARRSLSKMSFLHYDFLPTKVLCEIYCLHACLADTEHRLYKLTDNIIVPMSEEDIYAFIDSISLVDNMRYYGMIPLRSTNSDERRSASLNYQARGVLKALNRYFTIDDLMSWSHLPKAQRRGAAWRRLRAKIMRAGNEMLRSLGEERQERSRGGHRRKNPNHSHPSEKR